MVLFHLVLSFVLLSCINARPTRLKAPAPSECVTSFSTPEHRNSFDVCLESECFIFRTERPFVLLDPVMKTMEHQRPFLCSDYDKVFNGDLDGAFFKIVKTMRPLSKKAHCVWAGAKCTFDGILNFINASASVGEKHRWISGGILMVVPHRISANTLPSAALFEDEFRIVGPPLTGYTTPEDAWLAIWKPFTAKGWIFIFACAFGHILFRVWFSFEFTVPKRSPAGGFDWRQFKGRVLNTRKEKEEDNEETEETWQRINYFWTFIATIFVAITILFWEVAIAVQVYEARLKAPIDNIAPERFTIVENTSWETIFIEMVGRRAKYHQSSTMEQIYVELMKKDNGIDFTVVYELFNRYKFNQNPDLCQKLRVYDDVPSKLVHSREPPPLSAVWFYSSNVPVSRRIAIDRCIARHKQRGRILNIANDFAGEHIPDGCKMKTERIDWILLALLHAVVTGGLFLWLVFSVLWFVIHRRTKRCTENFHDIEDCGDDSSISTSSDGKSEQRKKPVIASLRA